MLNRINIEHRDTGTSGQDTGVLSTTTTTISATAAASETFTFNACINTTATSTSPPFHLFNYCHCVRLHASLLPPSFLFIHSFSAVLPLLPPPCPPPLLSATFTTALVKNNDVWCDLT
ncbi:hypothetical protein E2C01_077035 [Portunus trituberculatus]|uniref:Uncharacterized protein n=1 Tax=Portunus trituberculatus TaxID=210409 RepID=A0A5B7IER4_PORTR|nr:hypothetical protein [Portunus trituberculatus]